MKWRPIKLKTKISSRILALLIDNVGIYALIVGIFINIGKDSTIGAAALLGKAGIAAAIYDGNEDSYR